MSHLQDAVRLFAEREQALATRDTDWFDGATAPRGGETEDEVRLGLVEAGTRRLVAERLAADARADGLAWAQRGRELSLSNSEMARMLGMSREAIGQALGRVNGD